VPSVYCASLYFAVENATNFSAIVTSSYLEAGYPADGYVRVRGLSAVAVSYGPGTLSLANAIAGAYFGTQPDLRHQRRSLGKEHPRPNNHGGAPLALYGRPHMNMEVFQPLTAFCERVTDPAVIPGRVDQAIRTAITHKQPVYLEIPGAHRRTKISCCVV
jgi:TPP-dependent 2-oxoacid decarboxylase